MTTVEQKVEARGEMIERAWVWLRSWVVAPLGITIVSAPAVCTARNSEQIAAQGGEPGALLVFSAVLIMGAVVGLIAGWRHGVFFPPRVDAPEPEPDSLTPYGFEHDADPP